MYVRRCEGATPLHKAAATNSLWAVPQLLDHFRREGVLDEVINAENANRQPAGAGAAGAGGAARVRTCARWRGGAG